MPIAANDASEPTAAGPKSRLSQVQKLNRLKPSDASHQEKRPLDLGATKSGQTMTRLRTKKIFCRIKANKTNVHWRFRQAAPKWTFKVVAQLDLPQGKPFISNIATDIHPHFAECMRWS
jgi:hypothetical protein